MEFPTGSVSTNVGPIFPLLDGCIEGVHVDMDDLPLTRPLFECRRRTYEKENQGEAICECRANDAILTSIIDNTLMIGLT